MISPHDLLAQLAANNGVITILDPDADTRAAWRRAVHRTKQEDRVSEGFHLHYSGRDHGDLVIELMSGEHPDTQSRKRKPPGVEIPTDEAPEHPVLVELHNRAKTLDVSARSLPRALRLIRALITEAEHRGYHVSLTDTDWTEISFSLNHFQTSLSITEEHEVVEEFLATESDNKKIYEWQRVRPTRESVPTGRLAIALEEKWELRGRRRRWADRTRWSLPDKLGEIMAELDARAAIINDRAAAAERARTERQIKWERAMERAKERYLEDFRRQALLGQVNAFQQAKAIVDYCDALDSLAETDSDREAEIRRWAVWARSRAAELDPLNHHPSIPPDPEPGPEDLRPFLGGWSPHGPEERH